MSQKKKEDEGLGVGGWLALGIGAAAAIGGAIYLGTKLLDNEEQRKEEAAAKKKEDELQYSSGRDYNMSHRNITYTNPGINSGHQPMGVSQSMPLSRVEVLARPTSSTLSLEKALVNYYDHYVYVDDNEMRRARQVVDKVNEVVLKYLKEKSRVQVSELVTAGSTAEGLKVINPDEFDVEIQIPSGNLGVLDTGAVPDYVLLRAGVLSPKEIRSQFQSVIQRAINSIREFHVVLSTPGPAITAKVAYAGSRELSIDFVPVIVCGNQQYVAKPHPRSLKYPEEVVDGVPFSSYWRKSFSHEERREFSRFHQECVEKKCLKIMKAIKESWPEQLGQFRSYHFKTMLLHMLSDREQPDFVHEECLSEVFIDFLKYFENCLETGELPHFFVPQLNLFSELTPSALANSKNFLKRRIAKGTEGLNSLLVQKKEKVE